MIYAAIFLAVLALVATLALKIQGGKEASDTRSILKFASRSCTGAAVLLGIWACFTTVDAGHVGVQILFGHVQDRYLTEGLNLINPFVDVKEMSVRTETYTMSGVPAEGQTKGDDSIHALTSQGLSMPLEVSVAYRVKPDACPMLYRVFGPYYVDAIIRPVSKAGVRDGLALFSAEEVYSSKREQVAGQMKKFTAEHLHELVSQRSEFREEPIVIDSVLLRDVQLPENLKGSIEAKLQADQEAQRMAFVLQKERQEAERKRIEAQGIADFQRIVTAGISQPLLEWKGIEATMEIAKSPNSKVVIVGSGKNGLPIILGQ